MSTPAKTIKAFSEQNSEEEQMVYRSHQPGPESVYTGTQSSHWSPVKSTFSYICAGVGAGAGGRPTGSTDYLLQDLEAMAGGQKEKEDGHVKEMREYLLNLDSLLPQARPVKIAVAEEDAIVIEEAVDHYGPLAQKLFYISGVLLVMAWLWVAARYFGLDDSDFLAYLAILLVAAFLAIVLAL